MAASKRKAEWIEARVERLGGALEKYECLWNVRKKVS